MTGCKSDFDDITGIIGGPPCQAWSRRNTHRTADDPRSHLIDGYLWLVEESRPRFLALENVATVPAAVKTVAVRRGRTLSYETTSTIIDAADYGVAQTRRRWILIGIRDGTGNTWPDPTQTPGNGQRSLCDRQRELGCEDVMYRDRRH